MVEPKESIVEGLEALQFQPYMALQQLKLILCSEMNCRLYVHLTRLTLFNFQWENYPCHIITSHT